MKNLRPILILTLLSISGCQTSEVLTVEPTGTLETSSSAPEPRVTSNASGLLTEECALYYAIVGQMDLGGRKPANSILEGCSPDTSIGADITSSGSPASGANATLFRQKMIDRGVPGDLVSQVSRSKAFRDWLAAAR